MHAIGLTMPKSSAMAADVECARQIWRTPGFAKTTAPMQLHRTYGGCHGDVTSLDWSEDGRWIAVASKDLSARCAHDVLTGICNPHICTACGHALARCACPWRMPHCNSASRLPHGLSSTLSLPPNVWMSLFCIRVFSLHPLEGYRPATLTGHKDTVVAVFWAGARAAAAAQLEGEPAADLYTVSRDGAVFPWRHEEAAAAVRQAGVPEEDVEAAATTSEGGDGEGDDTDEQARKRRRVTEEAVGHHYAGLARAASDA